jgi:hypothetical protein
VSEKKEQLSTNPCWTKTNDKMGITPSEPITCPFCFNRNLQKAISEGRDIRTVTAPRMFLRRSRLQHVADMRAVMGNTSVKKPYAFDQIMKCPDCDFFAVFGVPTDLEYAVKVMELRGDDLDFYVPVENWMNSSEIDDEVKKRLEALGYV